MQTGARRGELCGLRWADVDMRARTVSFPLTKNGERRVVPMTDTFRDLLQSLPRSLDPQASVLPSIDPDALTVAFGRLVAELKFSNLKFHDL